MRELEAIRGWVEAPFHDIGDAGPVLDSLLAAMDAVLALHEHDPDFGNCTDCGDDWPCRTVAAVTDALEGEQ